MAFEHEPIKRRLRMVILLTSVAVLATTSSAFILYESIASRQELENSLRMTAEILAANASGFLADQSPDEAREMLASVGRVKHIVSAALFDRDGAPFASFPDQPGARSLHQHPLAEGKTFKNGRLYWCEPVLLKERRIGTLCLEASLQPVYHRFQLYFLIGILAMGGALVLALFLSNHLQKSISQPILELVATAKIVSSRRDYSVRARKTSDDEVGLLTEAFNDMLSQIQAGETALRDNAERLRLALEASETGAWDWNIEANQVTWDPLIYKQFGIQQGQAAGTFQDFIRAIHPPDRELVSEAIQSAIESQGEFNVEFRVVWPNGSMHTLVARGKAIYDARGRALRMTGVCLDLTERKKAEETRAFLAAIVESSDDAIIGKNLEGSVISWNSGAQRMFGYSPDEIIGRPVVVLTASDRPDEESSILARIRAGSPVEHYETVRMRKDGQPVDVSLSLSPIRNAKGQIIGVSSIARNISERRRAEEEIHRLNAELEQRVRERTIELTDANKELEAFTYSVSHDLRAPLRHIDAFARIVGEELAPQTSPELRSYIQRIRKGTQTMGRLIDDLLNLSRVGRAQITLERVDLKSLVEEVQLDLLSEISGRKIEWRIGALSKVDCDPGLMKQVFANLLSNAIKYTRPRPEAVIEVDQTRIGDQTVFFVRDNGVGFNMKYINKLFGVFERLHRPEDFEGTGIGLATVRRIIQRHNGQVWAEAELGKGATFYFTLPASSNHKSVN